MVTATAMVTAMDRKPKSDVQLSGRRVNLSFRAAVLTVSTLALGYAAFCAAFVRVVATSDPQFALQLQPTDPVALAAFADALALGGATSNTSAQTYRAALASLKAQALNPRGLRLMASAPEAAISPKSRETALALSHRLSRREIGTQLLLIEKNSQTDNIEETLKHYNYALTTDQGSWTVLFPILAAAIEDSQINQAFSVVIHSAQPWMGAFIRFKLENDPKSNVLIDAANAAAIKPNSQDFEDLKQYLFEQSVVTGNFAAAMKFFQKYKVADPNLLKSTEFVVGVPGARDGNIRWRLSELPYILPQIIQQAGANQAQLTVEGSSGAQGTVATKLLMLDPANYQINIEYSDTEFTPASSGTWTLRCIAVNGGSSMWRQSFKQASPLATTVSIPPDCEAQSLELAMIAGSSPELSRFTVKSIKFAKK
jgi:hypothetical protein